VASPNAGQRVALLGFGLAGEAFHAPLIDAAPGLALATVVTSDPERARRARERYAGVEVLGSAGELWGRAGEHELAVVAAPNRVHVELAMAALEAGLPVVVDKPLAANAADGRRLEEAAERAGLMLAVFHNRRWDGDFLTARGLVDDGALGEPWRLESRYERWRPAVREGAWRERGDRAEAGGVLFDLGSHLIDQALVLLGPAASVYAEVRHRRPGVAVDDDVFVALGHASGAGSLLWMSQAAPQPGPRLRLVGSRAAYVKWGLDVQEAALREGRRPGGPGWGEEPPEAWGRLGTEDDTEPVRTEPGDYLAFYRGVERALREGGPPPVTAGEAIGSLEVIEGAFESAESGQVVRV
jgi:scyllo-inositol 2-dehydrogenase (NADP+)